MQVIYKKMDRSILDGCIKGERLAQKKLYEMLYGKMLSVCLRYTSCREEASEILNQGFLKVFNRIKKFNRESGNLEGWIYRIMVNTAIDHYRKELKHRYHEDVDEVRTIQDNTDILADLTAEEILELVQKLTPGYRAVFNLYVIEGYNHKEIGEKLGISEGTSKSNLAKARMKLQKMIADHFGLNRSAYAQ